jgi:hypothetical protein
MTMTTLSHTSHDSGMVASTRDFSVEGGWSLSPVPSRVSAASWRAGSRRHLKADIDRHD